MMAALLDIAGLSPIVNAPARERSTSASVIPAPSAPIRKKSLRVTPSQKRCLPPQIVNIGPPFGRVWENSWRDHHRNPTGSEAATEKTESAATVLISFGSLPYKRSFLLDDLAGTSPQ
jgi:hypothetical protein